MLVIFYAFIWLMLFYDHILKRITSARIVLDTKERQLVVDSYTVWDLESSSLAEQLLKVCDIMF